MTTINEKGLKLAEEIKLNPEYSEIKKEVLIQFGFDPIQINKLVDWVSSYYTEDFEEITGDNANNYGGYGTETIDLLTEIERAEIGDILEEDDDPNKIIGYVMADGETIPSTNIEDRKRKERFAIVNKKEWFEHGQSLKNERLELGITLIGMGRILKTSTSRISNLENGRPVMMSENLTASYELAIELERMKQQSNVIEISKGRQIDHVRIIHYCGDLYTVNLVTASGNVIHIKDIEELKWAHLASNKFAESLDVPIVLQMDNGEKVRLDPQHSYC